MSVIFWDRRHQRTSQFSMPSKTVLVPRAQAKTFTESRESHRAGGTLKRTQGSCKPRSPSGFWSWHLAATSHLFYIASSGHCNTRAQTDVLVITCAKSRPSAWLSPEPQRVNLSSSICKSSSAVIRSYPAKSQAKQTQSMLAECLSHALCRPYTTLAGNPTKGA